VRRLVLILLVACAIATVAGSARSSTSVGSQPAVRMPALSQRGSDAIAGIHWAEHVYTASTGEPVNVSVSVFYPSEQPVGQRWADFFASLLHGPELARLKVYVAPLGEVQQICGGGAVGCYGDDRLIVTNEPARGFAPEEVARHEYGHHIARNRSNAPWPASDWGPKRWASSANVCRRVRWNTAYPGDESLLYKLNPGEGFAEAYRVLVDTKMGNARPSWPLVDASFYPDQARPRRRRAGRAGSVDRTDDTRLSSAHPAPTATCLDAEDLDPSRRHAQDHLASTARRARPIRRRRTAASRDRLVEPEEPRLRDLRSAFADDPPDRTQGRRPQLRPAGDCAVGKAELLRRPLHGGEVERVPFLRREDRRLARTAISRFCRDQV
jgi:hypothetical protein